MVAATHTSRPAADAIGQAEAAAAEALSTAAAEAAAAAKAEESLGAARQQMVAAAAELEYLKAAERRWEAERAELQAELAAAAAAAVPRAWRADERLERARAEVGAGVLYSTDDEDEAVGSEVMGEQLTAAGKRARAAVPRPGDPREPWARGGGIWGGGGAHAAARSFMRTESVAGAELGFPPAPTPAPPPAPPPATPPQACSPGMGELLTSSAEMEVRLPCPLPPPATAAAVPAAAAFALKPLQKLIDH